MAENAPPSTFNLADIWEYVAGRVPEREAVVCGEHRVTFAQLEARANQLANHLRSVGVGPGDTIGIFSPNCIEWFEALLAGWKLRALPFNINHRYSTAELASLMTDANAAALIFDRALVPVVAALGSERLGLLKTALAIDVDGSESNDATAHVMNYAEALVDQATTPPAVDGRSGEDRYLLYTGGTTGRPKGVLWRQEDAFFACFGGGDPMRQAPVTKPEEVADHIAEFPVCYLSIAPMMHAAGQWVGMSWLWAGGKVVLHPGSLDPVGVWESIEAEKVNLFTIVGDAVGRPLMDVWDENPGRWDVSALFSISNGGAPVSPTLKARMARTFPTMIITDGFGSSETGAQGSQRLAADSASQAARSSGVAQFVPYGDGLTTVLDKTLEPVTPGSGEAGRLALRGRIPVGYLGDEKRTADTFVEHAGHRWVLTGDQATIESDGTITLLGRGSQCINTGGEKVYSEEVELAIRGSENVADVVVVGVPDERWGEVVCAVVQAKDGGTVELEDLRVLCRRTLAGYKLPKKLVLVDNVLRSPAGKADYRWAHTVAEA